MSEHRDFRYAHNPIRPGESFKQVGRPLVAGSFGQEAGGSGKRKVGPKSQRNWVTPQATKIVTQAQGILVYGVICGDKLPQI